MSGLESKAKAVATKAHEGQTDKAGAPYIGHPERVVSHVSKYADTDTLESARVVAWLHDVVEDTTVTLDDLRQQFPEAIVCAIDAITKRPGENVDDYYGRVGADPLSIIVKRADMDDNTDPARIAKLAPELRARLAKKYAHAREVLSANP